MITYREDHAIDLDALAALRALCKFTAHPRDVVAQQVSGARWVAHAYDDGDEPASGGSRLVGFARAISDGVTSAYVSSVMVHPDHRRRGIGRALVQRLLADRPHVKFVLHTRPEAAAFYAAIGFAAAADMMMRDRLR